jgi:hypothetical protein
MKFMMLMIPAVYQGGKKVDPGFVPDPERNGSDGAIQRPNGQGLEDSNRSTVFIPWRPVRACRFPRESRC